MQVAQKQSSYCSQAVPAQTGHFFRVFIGSKSCPIGELQDFMIRVEFQARGSPHAHTILWIKDAPKIGVNTDEEIAQFIDRYQSCSLPVDDDEMRELVTSLQTHVHSRTCRRAQSCRFRFPHPPSDTTVIAKSPTEGDPIVSASEIKRNRKCLEK